MSRTDKDRPWKIRAQDTTDYYDGWGWLEQAPHWFITLWFEKPERQRVRQQSREALRDYNANGETDIVVTTQPHRHRGSWEYW